ncbi:MAG: DMT family transporter [Anaerolineae bacterium]|nr:DMT family transporter [Anaerolineae bacterium]
MNNRQPPSPHLVLLLGVLAVSTGSIFIRYAQASGAPSLVIAALRLVLATLILTPFALRAGGYRTIMRLSRRDLGLALLSGGMLAIHFASWITSLEHVSVLISVVLVDTSPLWVALLSQFLLKETLNRRTITGIGIAFCGGVLIALNGRTGTLSPQAAPLLGSTLALVGAISVALYLILGRHLRATLNVLTYIWLVYGTAAVVLLGMVALAGQSLTGYTPVTYLWILLLALIPQLLGHSAFNYALGTLPAAFVSLVSLGEPVGSAILAFLLLGELPAPLQIAGALLILFAVALARERPARTHETPARPLAET